MNEIRISGVAAAPRKAPSCYHRCGHDFARLRQNNRPRQENALNGIQRENINSNGSLRYVHVDCKYDVK